MTVEKYQKAAPLVKGLENIDVMYAQLHRAKALMNECMNIRVMFDIAGDTYGVTVPCKCAKDVTDVIERHLDDIKQDLLDKLRAI